MRRERVTGGSIVCSLPFPQDTVVTRDIHGKPVAEAVTKILPLKVDLCDCCAKKIYLAILTAPDIECNVSYNGIELR